MKDLFAEDGAGEVDKMLFEVDEVVELDGMAKPDGIIELDEVSEKNLVVTMTLKDSAKETETVDIGADIAEERTA